eukprot:1572320-Amphidinium_carterae.1
MVAEPRRFTMREGPGAMEDNETVEVYTKETVEMYNEYRMIEEKYETFDDNEDEYQTLRMNLKLPTPTQYDGKSPQFNDWAAEAKAYLTVHNVYIEDLMEDSTRSQVPMFIATMQRDAVANDLQSFNA